MQPDLSPDLAQRCKDAARLGDSKFTRYFYQDVYIIQLQLTECFSIRTLSDPRDHRVHQPAEDPEGLHAQFLQRSQGLHPGLAQIPEPRP